MPDFLRQISENLFLTTCLFVPSVVIALGLASTTWRDTWHELRQGRTDARLFFLILLLALAMRLGWILLTEPIPVSDYMGYWRKALELAGGDWTFTMPDKHPGIIMLMAACVKLFGPQPWTIWGMNLILSGFCLVLLYRIGLLLGGSVVAVLVVLLAALQPQLITYTALFASELPTLFFYLLLTWFALQSRRTDFPLLAWVALGCAVYAAVLTRSTALLFMGLIPVICCLIRKNTFAGEAKQVVIFIATGCLLLSSWLLHQQVLAGKPQLFWGSEIWLVSTTHYETEGRLVNPWKMPVLGERIHAKTAGLVNPESRLIALATMKEWAVPLVLNDPWRYLAEGRKRIRHILWTTSETGIRDSELGSKALRQWPPKSVTRLAEVSKQIWRVTLIFGLLGFMLLAFRKKEPSAQAGFLLMGGFLSLWISFHYLIAVASDRWAVQIIPFTLLFAGVGLTEVFSWLKGLVRQSAAPQRQPS